MSLKTRAGLLTGAAALTLSAGAFGEDASTTRDARIASLEARIAELESANGNTWLTEKRADEIRAIVHDVLADADTRSSMLQSGMTAGYDDGAVIGSADGNWKLKTNIQLQERFVWNHLEDDDDGGFAGDSDRWGFENTRTKFILEGHVVDPSWFYSITINVGSNGGGGEGDSRTGTGNAYVGKDFGNGWKLMMGSMKAPFLREELVDSRYQLAVERSMLNYLFTTGYTDGLAVCYHAEQWGFAASYNDGAGTGQSIWSAYDTEYAFTGRVEFLASGTWDQFMDFTSAKGSENGMLFGGAVHWQNGEYGTAAIESETFTLTGDASLEFDGANIYGAFIWSDTDSGIDGAEDPSPFGFVIQGGFYFTEDLEGFARYEWADLDTEGADDLSAVTIGVNKYFSGHNAKWTTDIGFGVDEVDFSPADLTGWRTDGNDSGQIVVRTQWQLVF
jgi:hypothetical protein